ncbi:neuropeptides capa receptor-like [Antedon mediterranea]|uniref:neuropeptides capa receptor-like n=1 Tax=Antedon mediterranea TaxID=105859 RepID=UPI003AF6C424
MNESVTNENAQIHAVLKSMTYTTGDELLLTVVIPILFIIGVVGNVFVIVVFIRFKSMRTAPYVYLFTLAVVDLMFLLIVAPVQWIMYLSSPIREDFSGLGDVTCKFYLVIQDFCVLFSTVIIVCVTIERYMAICHPMSLDRSKVSKRSSITCIVASIAILIYKIPVLSLATLAEYPVLANMDENITSQYDDFPDYVQVCLYCNGFKSPATCNRFNKSLYFDLILNVIVLPCVSTLYIRILYVLCSRENISDTGGSSAHLKQMKVQSACMIVLVVLVFIICTIPFRVFSFFYNLYANKHSRPIVDEATLSLIIYINRTLVFLNSAVNPIIYHIVSSKYRSAFKKGLLFKRAGRSLTKSKMTRETTLSSKGRQTIRGEEHNRRLMSSIH